MNVRSLIVVTLSFVLGGSVTATPAPTPEPDLAAAAFHDWIARESDNICGISDLDKVTNPEKRGCGWFGLDWNSG